MLCFGAFELDLGAYQLRRAGTPVKIEPQVLDVIAYLARHRDRVVPKEELLDEVWGDRFVSESALTSRIKSARQALGDDGRTQSMIRTAHGRGYQFVPLITESEPEPATLGTPAGAPSDVDTARAAVARAAWRDARHAFAALGTEVLETADLERWAEAAWWDSELVECIAVRHEAFRRYRAAGDDRAAARMAVALADDYLHRGTSTVARTWMDRAGELLSGDDRCREAGQLLRSRSQFCLELDNDPEGALELNAALRSLAEALGDPDLIAHATQDHGRILLALGRVDEGMGIIDQAMLVAATGDTSPNTRGRLYCNMLSACVSLGQFDRARDWSDEAITWCGGYAYSAFPGVCQVHRAGLRRRSGDLERSAVDLELASGSPFSNVAGAALLELGELHLLRGDVQEAEDALLRAHAYGVDATCGLARVAAERGHADDAVALLSEAVSERTRDRVALRQLLPALVDAAALADDRALAREAAERLEAICEGGSEACRATSERARGTVAMLEGDHLDACEAMRRAVSSFSTASMPFEVASARLGLAAAARAVGSAPTARLERDTALAAYRAAGASPTGTARLWLEQTADLA